MLFFCVFSCFLLLVVFSFILVDVVLSLDEWQSKIYIGRWSSRDEWRKKVETRARKWLCRSPTVRVTSHTRLVLFDVFKGKYRNSTIQTWQEAGLLLGFGSDEVVQYAKTHKHCFRGGRIMPEEFLLAYVLKKNGVLDKASENAILEQCFPLKDSGTIPYRKGLERYRYVDTIGMVLPFLSVCGLDSLAKRQIDEFDEYLLNGIYPPHACDIEKHLPLGVYDWARGIGWYILALVETSEKEYGRRRIVKMAEALLLHQKSDGGFSSFVFDSYGRMESSGTALAGLLFVEAFRKTEDNRFREAAKRVEKSLMRVTLRNGSVYNCQGDTCGIGFYSQLFSVMPFAQGLTLLLSKRLDEISDAHT